LSNRKSMKFCEICASRLSGNRDIEQLVNGNDLKASESLSSVICAKDCHLCLGILQRENFDDYKRAFRSSVEGWPLNSNQKVSDVQLLISVPAIITLLEKIAISKLKTSFPDEEWKDIHPMNMKDILKTICGEKPFGDDSQILVISDSLLKCEMKFENKSFEEDLIKKLTLGEKAKNETSYKLKRVFKMEPDVEKGRKRRKQDRTEPEELENKEPVVNATTVEKAIEIISTQELVQASDFIGELYSACSVDVQTEHESIFIGGRYLKFSRSLPQTPWILDNKRLHADTSVEEIIGEPFRRVIGCEKTVLSSSGREDVDVRTLGNGRPFIIECTKPRYIPNKDDIVNMAIQVNKSEGVRIEKVCQIDRQATKLLLEGETNKRKEYRAYCYSDRELDGDELTRLNLTEKVLKQRTPIRVLHRRNNDVRERTVHHCVAHFWEGKSKNWFYIDLETQAGTYIKEFVHGDFGRTVPNVSNLVGAEVDIVGLDVMNVKLEWPPEQFIKIAAEEN